jgi:hypothetical protein
MNNVTPIEYRRRFMGLARDVVTRLGAMPSTAPDPAAYEQEGELSLEFQVDSWLVRLVHRINPGAANPGAALIEIVVGTPASNTAASLHAHVLAMNELEWPAAYGLDQQTGELVYAWPVALDTAQAATIAQAIEEALSDFSQWDQVEPSAMQAQPESSNDLHSR